jgi:hypothetical protein
MAWPPTLARPHKGAGSHGTLEAALFHGDLSLHRIGDEADLMGFMV